MAILEDLTIYQGSTFQKEYTILESDGVTPKDLTGSNALMQIRKYIGSDVLYHDLYNSGHISIPVGTDGIIKILIPAIDSALLNFDRGVYDLEIHYPNSIVERLVQGSVFLSKEVTTGSP